MPKALPGFVGIAISHAYASGAAVHFLHALVGRDGLDLKLSIPQFDKGPLLAAIVVAFGNIDGVFQARSTFVVGGAVKATAVAGVSIVAMHHTEFHIFVRLILPKVPILPVYLEAKGGTHARYCRPGLEKQSCHDFGFRV